MKAQTIFCSLFLILGAAFHHGTHAKTFSAFGLHFGPDDPKTNAVNASLAEELGAKSGRYDLVLDELDYGTIDTLLALVDNRVTFIFTIHNGRNSPRYPEDIDDYLASVKNVVTRYQDRVRYWQIGNEVYGGPSRRHWWGSKEQYVAMLNRAYDAIKEVDSMLVVLPAGIATGDISGGGGIGELPDPSLVPDFVSDPPILSDAEIQALPREAEMFLGYAFKHGKFDHVIDLHLYYLPEHIPVRFDWLKQQLQKYQLDKQIIVTETAGPDLRIYGGTPPWPLQEQLKIQSIELVKRYVFILANGGLTALWQGPYKERTGNPAADAGALVVGTAQLKRPAYYTYKLLREKIGDFSNVEKLDTGQYKFMVNGQPVLVLWSDGGVKTIDVTPHLASANAVVTHIVTALDANNAPIYLPDEMGAANAVIADSIPILVTAEMATGVNRASDAVPQGFQLWQNYPNPFNPNTVIGFQLPVNSHVTLKVFNVLGREVATLVESAMNAGEHAVTFNAQNLPRGIYFFRFSAGPFTQTRKAMLMK